MEISKTYQRRGGQKVYECVAEFGGYYVLVWKPTTVTRPEPILILKAEGNGYSWVEYIEPPKPIIHTRYVHWLRSVIGDIITCTNAEPTFGSSPLKWIKTDKITYIEYPEPKQKSTKPPRCGCSNKPDNRCDCDECPDPRGHG